MNDKPSTCAGCSLYETGRGFCLGSGDPKTAKYGIVLEAPGRDEIVFQLRPQQRTFLPTAEECDRELAIRRRDYPDLDDRWLKMGVPAVGVTGLGLQYWILAKAGIRREDCFIDNTLRCLPPKGKTAQYPTGDDKKAAERHCRQYDRLGAYRPDTVVFSLHPAGLLREITPLPLAVKDFEKVRDFTAQGRKVLSLLGGKATFAFTRYGSNVTRWRGHYATLASDWSDTYKSLFDYQAKKRKKPVRLTQSETDEVSFFAIDKKVLKRRKPWVSRPEVTLSEACKSSKKYRGKSVPKCSCSSCWDKYEAAHATI